MDWLVALLGLRALGEEKVTHQERFEKLRSWVDVAKRLSIPMAGIIVLLGAMAAGRDMEKRSTQGTCIPMAKFEAIVKDGAYIPLFTGDAIHTGKAFETWLSPEKKVMVVTYTRKPGAHPDTVCLTEGIKDVSIDPDTVKTLMKVMEKQGGNPT